jgi:hypothetical protein
MPLCQRCTVQYILHTVQCTACTVYKECNIKRIMFFYYYSGCSPAASTAGWPMVEKLYLWIKKNT